MRAIYVDDERSAHVNFYYDMKDRAEIETLHCFFKEEEALAHAVDNPVDCAFLDINLGGGKTGIELAEKLKKIRPHVEIVFVTAYDEYARDAFRAGGRSYLSKPYTLSELDASLALLLQLTKAHRSEPASDPCPKAHTKVKTFGNFDILVDDRPVVFKNAKAKELLAFLINQRGGTVNGAQVLMALWEHLEYDTTTSTYVRRTVRALREELEAQGIEAMFIAKRNCYSVDTTRFCCDYYELMSGNSNGECPYNGEYMSQYSWGESTIPLIERKLGFHPE